VLIIVVGIWIVGSAKSFQQCIRDIKKQETTQHSKESISYFFVVLGRYKICSGVFIVENRDAVIALGTLGLVFFTGTLWWATRRLQQFAEIQSHEMRRSIKAAERAASAALRHVTVAEETAERQLRAYVFVISGEVLAAEPNGNLIFPVQQITEGTRAATNIRFQNTGQTPAYDVVAKGEIEFTDWPLDTTKFKPIEDSPFGFGKEGLGANGARGKQNIIDNILTVENMADLSAGRKAIVAHGRIMYRDAFKKERFTNYRFFTGGPIGFVACSCPHIVKEMAQINTTQSTRTART
jgi:hypothetical protein